MADPFLSEIRLMSFFYAPQGWALCDGQLLPVNQNQALFDLIGYRFGGSGANFSLPDMRGRVPVHAGLNSGNFILGQRAGEVAHTLTQNEMPIHSHRVNASPLPGNTLMPEGNILSHSPNPMYTTDDSDRAGLTSSTRAGGDQSHTNLQPYLVLSFCISLQGTIPV